jgi:PAS domain S-box-containing protein
VNQTGSRDERGLLETLRQAEENYRALFKSSPYPLWIYDTQTMAFLAVNDAAVHHYGYSEAEFLRMTIKDIRPPEEVPRLLAATAELGEAVYRTGLWRHRKKDGTLILVEITSHAFQFAGRKARMVRADDVTERERSKEALRQSEQRWRTLAAATFEGIAISQEGRFKDVNEQMARMLGFAREELIGKEIASLIPDEDRPRVMDNIVAGKESHIEHEMLRKDGTRLTVDAHGQTVELDGRRVRFTAVRDISARKQTERALQESEAKYRQLVDLMPAAVYACDCEGTIWYYNEQAAALWGCRPEIGRPATEYCGCTQAMAARGRRVPPEELPLTVACRGGQSSRDVEGLIERADGTRADVLVSVDPVRNEAGEIVGAISVLTDVTERKRTRTALHNQNRRLALLNEAAAQLLSAEEPDQAMAGIFERVAGYFQTSGFFEFEVTEQGNELCLKACQTVGEPQWECDTPRLKMGEGIVGTVAQQRQAMVLQHVQQSQDANTHLLRKLGVRAYACYPLLVRERLLGTLSFASRQRESFEAEDVRFFETLASYLALAKERLRLKQALQRHAANLERTVEERTTKLRELLGELEHMSYTIIHDMRAPLRALEGCATIIEQHEGERLSPSSRDLLERIVTATHRMDLLITGALNYNRAVREEVALQPVELGPLLRSMLRCYPEFEPARAEVRLEGDFPPVLANEAGLTQCFSNLLGNAVKFAKPGTKPEVRVWAEVRGEPAKVRVWVEDQGIGIPPGESQEKIFRMFQRLHGSEYGGTGMGLALVRKVVERMGGRVGVESELGQGSRFWIELALAGEPATPA